MDEIWSAITLVSQIEAISTFCLQDFLGQWDEIDLPDCTTGKSRNRLPSL